LVKAYYLNGVVFNDNRDGIFVIKALYR
jgi:hypothetical protein